MALQRVRALLSRQFKRFISFKWVQPITKTFSWFLLVISVAVILAGLLCVIFRPDWLLEYDTRLVEPTEGYDPLAAINEYRKTAIQLLGGIVIAIGLYLTWRRIRAMEKTVFVAEEGQITDRFSKGIEQLWDERLTVRLGGIFALERIARDSKDDHWPVMEVLSAFIRPYRPSKNWDSELQHTIENWPGIPPDIQAAVAVIGRRKTKHDRRGGLINLSGAYLHKAKLSGANFAAANLNHASLGKSDLGGAMLTGAKMEGVSLEGGILEGAILIHANLRNASLMNADVSAANLFKANLERVDFSGAKMHGANLENADLKKASFVRWEGRTVEAEGLKLSQLKQGINAHLAYYSDDQKERFAELFEEEE